MKINILSFLLILVFGGLSLSAQAEQNAIAMPNDSKLVQFVYDKSDTYPVLTRPGSVTDIVLNDDEQLVVLALGDTVQFTTSKAPGHIFIKPILPNLITTGSLVTTKRSYQLTFRSSAVDGKFYQQVGWVYPELIALQEADEHAAVKSAATKAQVAKEFFDNTSITRGVNVEKINFDYEIKGAAPFKPSQVFDDGTFTWIKMPVSQEYPAVFMLDDGKTELLNSHIKGDYIVVQRLVPRLLLKLGDKEVNVINRKEVPRPFFSWGE